MFPSRRISTMGGDVFRDEYSLAFDGTDDNIRIPETTYDIDGGTVSFVFWLKRAVEGVNHTILGHTSENSHKYIQINSSNDIKIESDTNNDASTITRNIEDAEWHHYIIAISSGTVTAYQDGVACSVSGTISSNNLTINTIGGQGTDGVIYEYNGNMSEIAIYNIALTSSQAKTIYNGREPFDHKDWAKSGNLTQWWRMGDGSLDSFGYNGIVGDETDIAIGSELITNGTMEADSNWANQSSPGTNERSTTQVYSGTYSRKFTPSSSNDGIKSDTFTSAVASYKMSFWVYPDDSTKVSWKFVEHDGTAHSSSTTDLTQDAWNYVEFYATSASAGSSAYVAIMGSDETSGDWYIDDVSVKKLGGNAGTMLNMTASDFVGDRP